MQTSLTLSQRITSLVEEILVDPDLFLVDVVLRGQKGSHVVEVYVDSEKGVNIDTLAVISRELGFMLETEELISGRYRLNVSSPGTDRPLRFLRQYPKHIGRTLNVKWVKNAELEPSTESVQGQLIDVTDKAITLSLPQDSKLTIEFNTIEKAKVVLPW